MEDARFFLRDQHWRRGDEGYQKGFKTLSSQRCEESIVRSSSFAKGALCLVKLFRMKMVPND